MPFFKTSAVCDLLDLPYHHIFALIRGRRFKPPQKDTSGDYVWTEQDVQRLREVLASRTARQQREPVNA